MSCRMFISSVATGGTGGHAPLPPTGMATGFVQILDFLGVGWG